MNNHDITNSDNDFTGAIQIARDGMVEHHNMMLEDLLLDYQQTKIDIKKSKKRHLITKERNRKR
jgi:hypothetical protein